MKSLKSKIIFLVILFIAVVGAVTGFLYSTYIMVNGQFVRRDSESVNLQGSTVNVNKLMKMDDPESMDLREDHLSVEDHNRLQEKFPNCKILWDIPLSSGEYDCSSASIALTSLVEEDIPLFIYFTELETIDARGLDSYSVLEKLENEYPEKKVLWDIAINGQRVTPDTRELVISSISDINELSNNLGYFKALEKVQVDGDDLSITDKLSLQKMYPETCFLWSLNIGGRLCRSDIEELTFENTATAELDALIECAPLFSAMKTLDFTGCNYRNSDMKRVLDAFPGADVVWNFTIYGVDVCSTDTEVDLSDIEISDTTEIETALAYMPHLEKVVMCDCGISNEDMDSLNRRYEDVRFVWMIRFGYYYLRTDETAFIGSLFNGSEANYYNCKNKDIEVLKYCTDMVALDLGHMSFTNLDFVSEMTNLRFLIIAECPVENLEPLRNCPNLFWLEMFLTPVTDLSPLLDCKELRHLNICHCDIHDKEDLKEMVWLERLWYMSESLTPADYYDLMDSLPDTEKVIALQGTATGGTWRYHDAYYEMRDLLGAFYMPGGTEAGVTNADEG